MNDTSYFSDISTSAQQNDLYTDGGGEDDHEAALQNQHG